MIHTSHRSPGWVLQLPALIGLLLMVTACSSEPSPPVNTIIASAAVQVHGEEYYTEATLDNTFLSEVSALLQQGEPIVATYRFFLYQKSEGLLSNDLLLGSARIKRRLHRHLIRDRFELLDMDTEQIHFTPDADEALRFIGQPRYVPLWIQKPVRPQHPYVLEVTCRIERDGVSRVFRLLDRLINFWKPVEHHFTTTMTLTPAQ
ncbi:MAG: DUF4390 domain-containing protein [Magnetococcales bacterium]|nr:DUF4390 domain-containing protein [Magnetococcales bacterium]